MLFCQPKRGDGSPTQHWQDYDGRTRRCARWLTAAGNHTPVSSAQALLNFAFRIRSFCSVFQLGVLQSVPVCQQKLNLKVCNLPRKRQALWRGKNDQPYNQLPGFCNPLEITLELLWSYRRAQKEHFLRALVGTK